MTLTDHIAAHHGGSQVKFAAANGVLPQQVTKWIKMECIVVDGVLYSPRRALAHRDN